MSTRHSRLQEPKPQNRKLGIESAGILLVLIPTLVNALETFQYGLEVFKISRKRAERHDEIGPWIKPILRLLFNDALDVMVRESDMFLVRMISMW
jgi:hypothetical protein